jgi:hypothetical protein
MKVLIIESTPATPHAETGLEIAIKENLAGSEVIYCPIFHLFPYLIWKSNINGRNASGKEDSIDEWLAYLTTTVSPFAEVDLFSLATVPNYLNESIRQNIFDFFYDAQPLGKLVKSNAIELFKTIDLNAILASNRSICEGLAQTAILVYELVLVLLRKHQPDLVYLFNGRTVGTHPIFLASQKLGVSTLVHERGSSKNTYIIWDRPSQYVDEFKKHINQYARGRSAHEARLSAATFFYRQRHGRVNNFGIINAQDHHLDISIPGCHARFVVYFTSSNNELLFMPGQEYANALGSQDEALTTLARVCAEENIQLIIKMHPNTPVTEQAAYEQYSNGDKCIVISADSSISSYKLGEMAYRNFSYGSTITWELMYAGKPCAPLADSYGGGEEGVLTLDSEEAIRDYLLNPLPSINRQFPIKYADFMCAHGENYDFYRPETLFTGTFDVELTVAI